MIPKGKDRGIFFFAKIHVRVLIFFFFCKNPKGKDRFIPKKKGRDRLNHGYVRV
jgi:hypothetical protein